MWNSQLTVLVATGVNSVWAVRSWKATNGEEIPTRVRKWRGEQWRYQLHDGMEDKPIGSLVAAARGEHLRLAFASKYGQVMVAMFGLDEKVNYGDDFDTWRLPQETGEYISAMARFDHEGRTLLAAASDRGNMVVWDFDTGEVLSSRQHGIAVRQLTVARSEHGALLVSCDSDERVRYWTLGLEPVHEIRIGERIKAIAAGREGCLVVATEGGLTGLYMDVAKLLASE
jgi:WD40 repeat protein